MLKINIWLTAFLILFLFTGNAFSQEYTTIIELLEQKFQSFEYEEVIRISGDILSSRHSMNNSEMTEIFRMRAISYYALQQEEASAFAFEEILKINSFYELDPVSNSPKIMDFFGSVKRKFLVNRKSQTVTEITPREIHKIDSTNILQNRSGRINSIVQRDLRGALSRSLIFPGWGHLYEKKTLKGIIFGTAGLASLGAVVYTISECSRKEKAYLLETDRTLIPSKYDSYNRIYKIRNISVAAFVVTWIYAQLDILYFSDSLPGSQGGKILLPEIKTGSQGEVQLNYRIGF